MDFFQQLDDYASKGFKPGMSYVYVLSLEENKYWVGETNNYIKRILLHTDNLPSKNTTEWTKLYKPISIIEIVENKKDLERDKTLEYMQCYGWQNVRGYAWTKVNMKNPPKILR
jgi:predicted GIY-YIG superfamily endonuclease